MTLGEVGDRIKNGAGWFFGPEQEPRGLTNNHAVRPMNRSLWLVGRGANVSATDQ